MKIKTLGPPPPSPPAPRAGSTLFKINFAFSPVFQYFALPEAFLQPRGSIFWILGAQKSTSAAHGKHILDSGTLDDARKLWPRPPPPKVASPRVVAMLPVAPESLISSNPGDAGQGVISDLDVISKQPSDRLQ